MVSQVDVGKDKSVSQGAVFFRQKLLNQCPAERVMHVHVTCCTDTKAMGVIIEAVMYF
jgi:hypothetical protein